MHKVTESDYIEVIKRLLFNFRQKHLYGDDYILIKDTLWFLEQAEAKTLKTRDDDKDGGSSQFGVGA